MAVILGTWLAGAIAVGIIMIGVRFFLQPHAAARDFGVPVTPDHAFDAFLGVKAIRDIASGLFIGLLIVHGEPSLLGKLMLAATIIPLGDAAIVLRHGGSKAAALGIHGATAAVMLVISGLLILG
jgi:hypothetical protein